MSRFVPLHIRTEILENLEWDEEMTDEAISRAEEVLSSLYLEGVPPHEAPKRAKKVLSIEYDKEVTRLLIEYLVAVANRIQNMGEA